MFINLFRRQRPALARLARNSNAYRQPMVAAVSSSAVGVSSITSAAAVVGWAGLPRVYGGGAGQSAHGRLRDVVDAADGGIQRG